MIQAPEDKSNIPGIGRTPEPWAPAFVLRLIFSGLLIYWVFRKSGFESFDPRLFSVHWAYIAGAYLLIMGGAIPGAQAWQCFLIEMRTIVPFIVLVRLNYIGYFFNSFLPTGVGGHFWRGYALSKVTGKTVESVASTVAERVAAFGSIALLGLFSLIINFRLFIDRNIFWQMALSVGVIGVACVAAVLLMPVIIGKTLKGSGDPEILHNYRELYQRNPAVYVRALLLNLTSQFLEALACWLLFRGMGITVGVLSILTLVPILRFVNHLPVSWNSVGTQDLTMVMFWGSLGVASADALSVSILMHVLRLMVGGTGGLIYVLFPQKPLKGAESP